MEGGPRAGSGEGVALPVWGEPGGGSDGTWHSQVLCRCWRFVPAAFAYTHDICYPNYIRFPRYRQTAPRRAHGGSPGLARSCVLISGNGSLAPES